jgi:hypothetical protein
VSRKVVTNLPESIRQKLTNQSRETGRPLYELLQYFVAERFLYRLGNSPHADSFVLKGAMMLRVWDISLARPTKDIDLLGPRALKSDTDLKAAMQHAMQIEVVPDGLRFDALSVRVASIRLHRGYQGKRVTFHAFLGVARVNLQLDIVFDDFVSAAPVNITFPTLLDLAPPKLRGYRPETTIAEKFHAMYELGLASSRMKDFYDISVLAGNRQFKGAELATAIRTTFAQFKTALTAEPPTPLTPRFFESETKTRQWQAFLRRMRLTGAAPELHTVVGHIDRFLMPVMGAAAKGAAFRKTWNPDSERGWE